MQDAYDRARETGGSDVFGVLAGLEDDPDVEQAAPASVSPEKVDAEVTADIGEPVEAPPPSPVQTSAPGVREQRLAAAREASRLAAEPLATSTSSDDVAAAQGRDRDQRKRDAFTEAIQAWLMRRPQRFTSPTEGDDALKRRQLEESSALKQRAQGLSAQQLLVKSLAEPKGSKPAQTFEDPYHTALGDQARSLVDERKRKGEEARLKSERETTELAGLRETARELLRRDVSHLGANDIRLLLREKGLERRAAIMAAERAKKQEEGRPLAPSALGELADADVAKKQVEGLAKTFNELGMGTPTGKASAFVTDMLGLQFTDAAKFDAESRRVQQAAGKILEGGKLAAGDETKYRNMLLKPGDAPEIVAAKTAGMVEFLEDVKAGRIKVYRAGGYKVPESLETPKAAAPAAPDGKVRVRRKSDGVVAPVAPDVAQRLLQKGTYEPE